MNNYIALEVTQFEKKLNAYIMMFNYRMANYCVKAETSAMVPVTVELANTGYNLEDVADIFKPNDFTFVVFPKNQNNLQQVIDGIFDMHPEFKMEIVTEKDSNDQDVRHLEYTMPEVDKNRRDLLNETTKTFHKECQANLDATYAKEQERLAEPLVKMSPAEADEAKNGFKKVYDDAKAECDQLLQFKLNEIEEGYQRYLENNPVDDNAEENPGYDVTKGMKLTEE